MRIPLKVEILVGSLKPVLYVRLSIPQFHISKLLRMFIDTGSTYNIVSERDSEMMQIPFLRIHEKRAIFGVGGDSVTGHAVKNALIVFKDEEGKLVHKNLSLIYAVRTEKRDAETIRRVKTFPSILGINFLVEHKYKLIFDPANESAWLET